MADVNIPASGDAGLPSFASQSIAGTPPLFTGDTPVSTLPEPVAASTTLAANSVVGRDGSGDLVLANLSGPIVPVGITVGPVATGVGVVTTVEVYKSGMFNPDVLVWHADYNTDAKKKAAFEGSKIPGIFILKPRYVAA